MAETAHTGPGNGTNGRSGTGGCDAPLKAILATSNPGKVAELATPLATLGVELAGLEALPGLGEIAEDGASFEENALIKARAVAAASGLTSVADDSGLMVDALGGAPGIHSARYADDWAFLPGESRDQRNIRKLLHAMRDVPASARQCHFVTVMAVVRPDGAAMTVRGEWPGLLLDAPRGSNGFGYDPIFLDPAIGKAAAELSREEKGKRSHRGRAVAALLARWPGFMHS